MPANPNYLSVNYALPQFNRITLTSASPTALTVVQSIPGILYGIQNTGAAQTVYLRLFDESVATGTQADCIWGDGTSATALSAGFSVYWHNGLRLYSGLTYSLTGALSSTANVILLVQ